MKQKNINLSWQADIEKVLIFNNNYRAMLKNMLMCSSELANNVIPFLGKLNCGGGLGSVTFMQHCDKRKNDEYNLYSGNEVYTVKFEFGVKDPKDMLFKCSLNNYKLEIYLNPINEKERLQTEKNKEYLINALLDESELAYNYDVSKLGKMAQIEFSVDDCVVEKYVYDLFDGYSTDYLAVRVFDGMGNKTSANVIETDRKDFVLWDTSFLYGF